MRVRILLVLLGGQGLVCNAFSPAPHRRGAIRVIESGPLKALPGKSQKSSVEITVNDVPRESFVLPSTTTPSEEGATKRRANPMNKVIVSALCSLMILLAAPLPSHAGFGSGGAAVSSFPEIKPLSTEEFLKLSPKKQRQREFSVSCFSGDDNYCKTGATRLYEEVKQFNTNAKNEDALAQQLESLEERALASSKSVEEGARIQLEESLKEQAELLDRLGQQPPYVSYVAAAIGSIVSTLIMHPVDTIKVQLMNTQGEEEDDEDAEGDSLVIGDASPAASAIDFANVYYKGIVANIFKEAPSSALYLGVYELVRTYLTTTSIGQEPLLVYLLAGSVGELFGSMLRAPAEAVKTRLQVGDTSNALQAAEQVLFSESGRNNLFQSWSASLWRDIPMGAIQLAIFESVKTYVISSPDIQLDVSSLASEALFGAIGGSIGAFLTTPADVITTISINSLSDTNLAQYKDKSPIEVFQILNDEGGIAAVFTGWKERTLYWTPAIGIFLSIYCGTRQLALSVLG